MAIAADQLRSSPAAIAGTQCHRADLAQPAVALQRLGAGRNDLQPDTLKQIGRKRAGGKRECRHENSGSNISARGCCSSGTAISWQDWLIFALVVAIPLNVMVTCLPYRLDEAAQWASATAGCQASAPPGRSHELEMVWTSDQYQQPAPSLIIRSPLGRPASGCNCHSSTPKFAVKGRSC